MVVIMAVFMSVAIEAANRKAYIRYVNSMPQFGKAKFSAFSPQTVVFDQVAQGYITDYSNLDAKAWNFTTQYSTNATASSDETDLDSDTYATVFTCQTSQRRLKNKVIFDVGRSFRPNFALLRTVNLAQFNYDVDVFNGSSTLFNSVPYCSASAYIQVPPGDYDFDWSVSDDKKRGIEGCPPNCSGPRTLTSGSAYTLYVTPTGSYAVQDAKKTTARNVQSDMASEAAEEAPVTEERVEKVDVTDEVKEEKETVQVGKKKVNRKTKRHTAQRQRNSKK